MKQRYWWQQNLGAGCLALAVLANLGYAVITKASEIGEDYNLTDNNVSLFTKIDVPKSEMVMEDTNFLSDDLFALQTIQDADITKKKKEEEEERKRQEELRKERERQSISTYATNKKFNGRFRLAEHNDDDATIVSNINRAFAGYPVAGYGDYILNVGKEYNIDPYVIAAVTIEESGRGTSALARNNNNLHGRKASGGGWKSFPSFEACFTDFGAYLSQYYLDVGLTTLDTIQNKYCPNQGWAFKIKSHIASLRR